MLKLECDFNDWTERGEFWLLRYEQLPLEQVAAALNLRSGVRVLLQQDPDDFIVEAELGFGFIALAMKEVWFAVPDWNTRKD